MKDIVRIAQIIALAALVVSATASAHAASEASKELYVRYCGACHGPGGKGDGLVSGLLKTPTTDLTQIAKNNGGKFPFNTVMHAIDGTKTVRAHGNPDMPVWAEIFKEQMAASPTRQAEIRGKILMITDYISSIQEK